MPAINHCKEKNIINHEAIFVLIGIWNLEFGFCLIFYPLNIFYYFALISSLILSARIILTKD